MDPTLSMTVSIEEPHSDPWRVAREAIALVERMQIRLWLVVNAKHQIEVLPALNGNVLPGADEKLARSIMQLRTTA